MDAGRESEIARLTRRLGDPLRWSRVYEAAGEKNARWARNITRRSGEVVLAVPAEDGRYIVHTKAKYPQGVFRLPGGGINPGEEIEHAALREMGEEMGFNLELDRFLGVIENAFVVDGEELFYPSLIISTRAALQPPRSMDPDEEIAGFDTVALEEFPRLIEQLMRLPAEWQPWGRFRAAPHDLAWQQLRTGRREWSS